MLKGFRDFISRGNAIDLAVGVIIGAAFSAVVNSIVADIFMPVIGRIFGSPDFSGIVLFAAAPDSGGIDLGQLITAVVNLFIIAFALYFFIVIPMNALQKKKKEVPQPPAATPADIQLLTEIRDLLKKQTPD
jgi:large conductance mechanosensitive channel